MTLIDLYTDLTPEVSRRIILKEIKYVNRLLFNATHG